MSKMWMYLYSFLTLAAVSGRTGAEHDIDEIDAIAGKTLIISKWPTKNSNLTINVRRGNTNSLRASIYAEECKIEEHQKHRLLCKWNNYTREISLMFDKVSTEDEGQYEIIAIYDKRGLTDFEESDGAWKFQLNVFERHEVMHGLVGENMVMKFQKGKKWSLLYRYDKMVAFWLKSDCWTWKESILNDRLQCTIDEICIQNITERDSGLFQVRASMNSSAIQRWFLQIIDKTTYADVGDNVTIAWSYNQQWMNRTIQVIHPKEGIMMLLPSTNIPNITSTFQHRLLYSGDVSRCYMSFTLLNVNELDTGFYRINTLQWKTIPGRKQLIVKVDTDTSGPNTGTSSRGEVPLDHGSNDIHDDQNASVPIYFVIIIVTGVFGANLLMIGCLIWIHRKNTNNLETVHRRFLDNIATSFVTPSTKRNLQTPLRNEAIMDHSSQQPNLCQKGLLGVSYAVIPEDRRKVDTAYSSVCSLESQEGEKPEQLCMKKRVSHAWDEAAIDEPNWSKVNDESGRKEDAHSTCAEDLYAKVMKGPRFAPKPKRRTIDLCTDVYEMVNISLVDDPNSRFREGEIVSEALNPLLQEISNLRKNSDAGTNEEDGDEACENITNMTFAKDVTDLKDRKTVNIENKGPRKELMTECGVTATKESKY